MTIKELLNKKHPHQSNYSDRLAHVQFELLRQQRALQQTGERVVIVVEGIDCAGKGGVIKRLTEKMDPRGFDVHLIGPPNAIEAKEHYLQRFWRRIPREGKIAIFDRSWYGRVLVENVENLTPKKRIKQAFKEINEFEKSLVQDGVVLIKLLLVIDKDEQRKRLQARINDKAKLWKIGPPDIRARALWEDYLEAFEELYKETNTEHAPWDLVAANEKHYTRVHCLEVIRQKIAVPENRILSHRLRHIRALIESIEENQTGEFDLTHLSANLLGSEDQ